MDDDTRKIGMLIAAFDAEHARLQQAVGDLYRSSAQLKLEVKGAAREAVEVALRDLHPQIDKAGRTLIDIQRLSLWRAAQQHLMVAIAAIIITLLGVYWYVPAISEITALRSERDQLQVSIENLNKRGARMTLIGCGPQKRLCVLVDRTAGTFGVTGNKEDVYMIAKGY